MKAKTVDRLITGGLILIALGGLSFWGLASLALWKYVTG